MGSNPRRSSKPRARAVPPARRLALEVLRSSLQHHLPLQEALDSAIARHGASLDPRDVGLATESVYGVFRYLGRLNFLLHHRLARPGSIPQGVMRILLLATYELLFLERVPAYATVNWAVDAVKAESPKLAKVANGVLRGLDRMRDEIAERDFYLDAATDRDAGMAAWYGVPQWLFTHVRKAVPELAHTVFQERLSQPPLGLRANPRSVSAGQGGASLDQLISMDGVVAHCASGVAFAAGSGPEASELGEWIREGRVSRQSLASQEALLALKPETWTGPILDCCAGRGGKTLLYMERWDEEIWASDFNARRLSGIPVECARLNLKVPPIFRADARHVPLVSRNETGRHPQTILIDAPCSGLGVMSRRPDLAWRLKPHDLANLRKMQAEILDATAALLSRGSKLLYLTCTIDPLENERTISGFLERNGRFEQLGEFRTANSDVLKERFYAASLRAVR
ncbi:transcription antitermination factor NusB [Oceanidesulfovibrio marinus]|uniref:Fmu (Sun) domain-containing protein n=1 Tax=Oceanidesulfovibrio marinus TaxID=370038 RepID=A0ABX6NHC5_9BACT|nr:transcription antitermination factor NusB [Oceanidesulfovibrio marinus]QJT10038.1 Fmu (Sun) domain-containing protein [Oceanidesulfovibrio marinus]